MGAQPGIARHPQIASIPDPKRVEGVRAYREPEVPHPLQLTFLEADGERAWIEEIRGLLSSGRAADADARLSAELEGFDGSLARLCKATSSADVTIEGWEDLLPILEEWEGPPVTAITLGLTNAPDLVFEAGKAHEADLLLALYSDDAFPFTSLSKAELVAECGKDCPGWVDGEEDVEFYCTFSGLADLNTALIQCKHRYFLRDGRDGVEGRAPGGYVEFILGSWLLATRFLQAAERAIADHGVPDGCRVIAGTVGVNADFVTVLGSDRSSNAEATRIASSSPASNFASLTMKPWVPKEDPTAEPPAAAATTFRERLKAVEPPIAEQPKRGFLARLFGRVRRG